MNQMALLVVSVSFNSTPHEAGIPTIHASKGSLRAVLTFNSTPREAGIATLHFGKKERCLVLLSIPPRAKRGLLLAAIEDQRVMTKVPFNSTPREAGIATLAVVVRVCWHSTFNSRAREAWIATPAQFKGAILFSVFQFPPARSGDCYKHFFDVGERRGLLSIPPRAKRGLLPFKKASVSAAPILSIPPRAKRGLLPTSRLT